MNQIFGYLKKLNMSSLSMKNIAYDFNSTSLYKACKVHLNVTFALIYPEMQNHLNSNMMPW